ncbi:metallophosphoesterase [Cellulomonas sp.]|uniref:metallophosphoesterase family protein n=1 Tax=Cellulomonas sp. TaxID=40001 RepID=UPI002582E308|nr:metallophosphoesterase [Cellulomonas sp.]MCR6690427.1 metallophosphoesterase [Cellulomonas sp.]
MDEARTHRPPWERWAVRGALALVAVLFSAAVGLVTAHTQGSFGPHLADYAVTTDGTVTVDLGPLGTLEVASPLPVGLGAHVTVQEIPSSFTEVSDASTLESLSGDLQVYVQFFSGPQATVADVTQGILLDALRRAVGVLTAIVVVSWLVRLLLGATRRAEIARALEPHRGHVAVGTVLVLVVVAASTSSAAPAAPVADTRALSHVFDGTPLEGARVTGRLGGVIDTYGAKALAAYRTNQEFYERADASLVASWDQRAALEAATVPPRLEPAAPSAPATAPATAPPTGPGGPPTTTSPTQNPTPTPTTAPEDLVVALVVTDLHCNVGMARLLTSLAERADVDVVLDAGDTTMNGTAVEQYCVTTFARAVPDGVELVTSPGNHDSAQTSGEYAAAGARVLDGSVVEVDGLRILGDSDPNETRVGGGTASLGESLPDTATRLAETACDDEDGVDLLLVHTPEVGETTLDRGCAPAQVSGHLHRRYGPEQIGLGIRYISSSTAGATLGQPTIGPLRGDAELTLLRWDPATRLLVDYRIVTVRPDASALVGPAVPWPAVRTVPDEVPRVPGGPAPV